MDEEIEEEDYIESYWQKFKYLGFLPGHHGRTCTTGVVKSELHFLKVTPDVLGKQGQNLKQENSPEEIALKSEMMVVEAKLP